ncbi:MAG: hypothetical protein KAS01_00290 [Candidatus Pacebacteria bacterium]|nr:hypothetical protein [Candidatus Paceibacterota bacterium]
MKNIFFTKKNNLNNDGFSLIEIIFSIGIITIGLVSILSLFGHNIKSGISNRDKLIAIYLAEEQIEVIRQLRDTNWKTDSPGITWVTDICNLGICPTKDFVMIVKDTDSEDDYDFTEGWEADTVNNAGQEWKKEVFKDSNSYFHPRVDGETLGEKTKFIRWLNIKYCETLEATDCLEITSNVSHPNIANIEIKTRLYNWK